MTIPWVGSYVTAIVVILISFLTIPVSWHKVGCFLLTIAFSTLWPMETSFGCPTKLPKCGFTRKKVLQKYTRGLWLLHQHRFSAFWLRSKCSICSYQLNIWYGHHVWPQDVKLIFVRGWRFRSLLRLCHRLAWHCSIARSSPYPSFTCELCSVNILRSSWGLWLCRRHLSGETIVFWQIPQLRNLAWIFYFARLIISKGLSILISCVSHNFCLCLTQLKDSVQNK